LQRVGVYRRRHLQMGLSNGDKGTNNQSRAIENSILDTRVYEVEFLDCAMESTQQMLSLNPFTCRSMKKDNFS
jgi:hypothetical protein